MRKTAKYSQMNYKGNEDILKELKADTGKRTKF
jgi:hypothetical protein